MARNGFWMKVKAKPRFEHLTDVRHAVGFLCELLARCMDEIGANVERMMGRGLFASIPKDPKGWVHKLKGERFVFEGTITGYGLVWT